MSSPTSTTAETRPSSSAAWTNVGNTATTDTITLTDTLPSGLGFVSGTGTGWNCAANAQVVTCTNPGPIAGNNGSSTVTLTVSVAPAAVPSVTNTASVSTPGDSNPANNTASDPTTIIGEPDLSVSIAATRVRVGGPITFTATVSNSLGTSATGVTLSTTLSPSLIVNSITPGQGGSCANLPSLPANIGSFTCNWTAVFQGDPVTVTVTAVAPASGNPCGSSPLGCITVTSSVTENEIDFNQANNSASVIQPLLPAVPPGAGHFVYTNDDQPSNTVSAFSAGSDGSLTPIAGSPFATGGAGQGGGLFASNRIGVGIAGNFLFASNAGSNNVSVFSIDPNTGVLTPVAGSPFATAGSAISGMAVSPTPDGKLLMAADSGSNTINVFSVGSNGALTPIAGSPFTTLGQTDGIKVSPDGKFLAVAEISPSQVEMFNIASNGSLTSLGAFPGKGGAGIAGVDIDCATAFLYAGEANFGNTIVDAYSIASNGTLTPLAGSPFIPGVGSNSNLVLLSPDDKTLFVSNQDSRTITAFSVASNGSLSLLAGSPFSMNGSGLFPSGMAVSKDGTLLYVADFNPAVSAFSVASNGTLTEVPGSPFSTEQASPIPGQGLLSLAAYPPKACVSPVIDLALAKSHTGNFTAGTDGVYSLTVTNVGNAATTGTITLTDTLPSGLGFVSGTGTGWNCAANAQVVTCTNPGPIAGNGGTSTLTLTVSVAAAAVPSVTNQATVSAAGDTNAANNIATDTANVVAADLSVSMTASPTILAP